MRTDGGRRPGVAPRQETEVSPTIREKKDGRRQETGVWGKFGRKTDELGNKGEKWRRVHAENSQPVDHHGGHSGLGAGGDKFARN